MIPIPGTHMPLSEALSSFHGSNEWDFCLANCRLRKNNLRRDEHPLSETGETPRLAMEKGTQQPPVAHRQCRAWYRVVRCGRLVLEEFGNTSSNRTLPAARAVIGKICLP